MPRSPDSPELAPVPTPLPRLTRLDDLQRAVWQELQAAVRDKHHAWRTPVLATTTLIDGELTADARTVVLRELDLASRQLLIFTDTRSAKAQQLRLHPRGSLVMWSARLGWQLRCRVRLSLAEDGLAVSSRWSRLKLSPAALDYLSPLAPGTPLDPALKPTGLAPREAFAIITADIDHMDWLELHPEGHRRAAFTATGAHWLQP